MNLHRIIRPSSIYKNSDSADNFSDSILTLLGDLIGIIIIGMTTQPWNLLKIWNQRSWMWIERTLLEFDSSGDAATSGYRLIRSFGYINFAR